MGKDDAWAGADVNPTTVVLTVQEKAVLAMIGKGHTNARIARSRFISEETVSAIIRRLMARAGACNRTNLAIRAVALGWCAVEAAANGETNIIFMA